MAEFPRTALRKNGEREKNPEFENLERSHRYVLLDFHS
jgi:hypothetical protein